jgi:hypothetical protein
LPPASMSACIENHCSCLGSCLTINPDSSIGGLEMTNNDNERLGILTAGPPHRHRFKQRLNMRSPFASLALGSMLFLMPHAMSGADGQDALNCLPSDIRLADVVETQRLKRGTEPGAVKRITVKDKLAALKARCEGGGLVDADGREIRFYRLQGCWGNPPANYREILARQQKELEDLKKRFTVIEMTCNPSGAFPY